MSQTAQAAPAASCTRTFYSRAGCLTFYPEKPKRVIEDGQSKVLDGTPVTFNSTGIGTWGIFTTADPVQIAACEARGDLFSPEEYSAAIVPDAMKVKSLEDGQSRLLREIQEKNALIEKLQAQGRIPRANKQGDSPFEKSQERAE